MIFNFFLLLLREGFNSLKKHGCHDVEIAKTSLAFHRKMERLAHLFVEYQERSYST